MSQPLHCCRCGTRAVYRVEARCEFEESVSWDGRDLVLASDARETGRSNGPEGLWCPRCETWLCEGADPDDLRALIAQGTLTVPG
jgi:hypothetical protein